MNCNENVAGEYSTQNVRAVQRGNRRDHASRNTNSCTDDISLPEGFPLNDLYYTNKKTCRYKRMEHWSDAWQVRHNVTMQKYGRKWVSDPLHWWSRSYEYSYLIQNIQSYIQNHPGVSRIVNLGKATVSILIADMVHRVISYAVNVVPNCIVPMIKSRLSSIYYYVLL